MQPEPELPRTDEVSDEDRAADAAGAAEAPAEGEDDGDVGEVGIVRSDAPQVPWTIDLHSSLTHYTPLRGGGMLMQFTVAIPTPQGIMPMPPGVRVAFSGEGWARFKAEVEKDGARSQIQTAVALPENLRGRFPR